MSVRTAPVCMPLALAAALFAALLAAAPLAAAVPGSGGAKVDGVLLPPERIWDEYRFQYCARAMIHSQPSNAVDEQLLGRVVEQVVGAELLSREAARRGYTLTAQEQAALREAEVKRWRGEDKFRTACRLLQVEEPFVIARAARQRVVEAMAVGESGADQGLTDKILEEHYRGHLGDYLPAETPAVRYIFVPAGPGVDRALLNDIAVQGYALAAEGKSFLPLVERYSKHPSAATGGYYPADGAPPLPFQPPSARPKECRLFGEMDDSGLHLYLRDCRQPLPFAGVRDKVRANLIGERRARWLKELADGLRKKAKIEYFSTDTPPPPPAGSADPAAGKMKH